MDHAQPVRPQVIARQVVVVQHIAPGVADPLHRDPVAHQVVHRHARHLQVLHLFVGDRVGPAYLAGPAEVARHHIAPIGVLGLVLINQYPVCFLKIGHHPFLAGEGQHAQHPAAALAAQAGPAHKLNRGAELPGGGQRGQVGGAGLGGQGGLPPHVQHREQQHLGGVFVELDQHLGGVFVELDQQVG